jgi:hypothetical protein
MVTIPINKFTWTENVGIADRSDLRIPEVAGFAVQGQRNLVTFSHYCTKRDADGDVEYDEYRTHYPHKFIIRIMND